MKPTKILHVLDHSIPLHSGYTFRTRSILKQQHELGFETVHVTSSKQGQIESDQEQIDGLTFYRTQSGWLSGVPVLNQYDVIQTLAKRIKEVIKLEKPDVIHAHSPALNGIAAIQAAKSFNIPVVYEVRAFWEDAAVDHGTTKENSLRYKITRHLETYVFENVQAITCICEGLRRDIKARGFSEEKITVIPNAVNVEQFEFCAEKNDQLSKELGLTDDIVIGFIGSFYAYEGLDLLIDSLPLIESNYKVLLVGGGNEEQSIKNKVKELGLEEKVIFTGRVPHEQVSQYYDLVDIFVYPRKSMRLTDLVTPLKPLEAMAKGKVIVASDVGGHRELIQHGETGFLFAANNEKSLAMTIDEVIAKKNDWDSVKKNGRHYVENVRNWRNSVSRYRDVYGAVLS